MVRILLVAALVVLGMAVVVLGLAPVAPEQAPQAVEGALVGVAVAVVLVAVALARVLAEVPEEVQELEALVLQAAQAQVVRDQVNLPPVRVKAEEDLFHLQAVAAQQKAVVQMQEQSEVKKTQPQHRVVSPKVHPAVVEVVKEVAVARNKKAGKKK